MTPRIAFACGLARLLLAHTKDLTDEDRAYIQTVADATTMGQMQACWHASAYFASVAASAAASSAASASAFASVAAASAFAASWSKQACTYAVKAGVPEDAVAALRALTLGETHA